MLNKDATNRNFIQVKKRKEINYLIDRYLNKKKVFIKGIPNTSASFRIVNPYGIIELQFNEPYQKNIIGLYEITIYTVLKRYIEITLHQVSSDTNQHKAKYQFIKVNIANQIRNDKRINVKGISAYNFKLDKYSINPNMLNLPIAVQLSFDKYKNLIIKEFENSSVEIFDGIPDNKLLLAVKKLQKSFYVKNMPMEEAETGILPDYKSLMKSGFKTEMDNLRSQGIRSILIHPIIYTNLKNEKTTLGYFKIHSFSKPIDEDTIAKLNYYADAINNDIKETTYQTIKTHLKIANISKRGLQIIINHQSTVDMFLIDSKNVIFNIKLNNDYPTLTLTAKIINISLDKDYIYKLGIHLHDKSKDIKLWDKYIYSLTKS